MKVILIALVLLVSCLSIAAQDSTMPSEKRVALSDALL